MAAARTGFPSGDYFRNSYSAAGAPDPATHPEAFEGLLSARIFAFLADLVVFAVIFLAVSALFGILGVLTLGLLLPAYSLLPPLLFIAYFAIPLGGPWSATPGMRWQGIEMRTWDGRRPGFVQALFHTLLFYIIGTPLLIVSFVIALLNPRKRCLHDIVSGAVFVRTSSRT